MIVKWRLQPLGQGHAAQHQRGTDGRLKGEGLVEDEDAQQGGDDGGESPKDVALAGKGSLSRSQKPTADHQIRCPATGSGDPAGASWALSFLFLDDSSAMLGAWSSM